MRDRYLLPHGVFACRTGGTVIFLDARHDRYACLNERQSAWFAEIGQSDGNTLSHQAECLATQLTRRGLLCNEPETGRTALIPACAPRALNSLVDTYRPPLVYWRSAPHLLLALWTCRPLAGPRRRPLADALRAVGHWKSRLSGAGVPGTADLELIVRRFHGLTPYFFTTQDACYLRSLTLIRYLAGLGISADWVFGVRLAPFGAHCWVERDGLLLNESSDVAAEYEPLMAV
ncbi:lasso peptide biosynthesis B2 protein [Henriciella aquimarina]|uniref:lasso peptide biosynthesis B2 protein n=1 Tax=Henriciella aquimarina TaxID=545261 RepID=UPI001301E9DD|nr:lasso peptide biosynthesis B2 protein [Henriciella aquimarina]